MVHIVGGRLVGRRLVFWSCFCFCLLLQSPPRAPSAPQSPCRARGASAREGGKACTLNKLRVPSAPLEPPCGYGPRHTNYVYFCNNEPHTPAHHCPALFPPPHHTHNEQMGGAGKGGEGEGEGSLLFLLLLLLSLSGRCRAPPRPWLAPPPPKAEGGEGSGRKALPAPAARPRSAAGEFRRSAPPQGVGGEFKRRPALGAGPWSPAPPCLFGGRAG